MEKRPDKRFLVVYVFHVGRLKPGYFDHAISSLPDNSDAEPIHVLTRIMHGVQAACESAEQGIAGSGRGV